MRLAPQERTLTATRWISSQAMKVVDLDRVQTLASQSGSICLCDVTQMQARVPRQLWRNQELRWGSPAAECTGRVSLSPLSGGSSVMLRPPAGQAHCS